MKLKDKDLQPPTAGLPASYREWWDLGDGYEAYVWIGEKICNLSISSPEKDVTHEVAQLLGLDTSKERYSTRYRGNDELYVSTGIDCAVLNYTKPSNYKELLKKIEEIVNVHFKNKNF